MNGRWLHRGAVITYCLVSNLEDISLLYETRLLHSAGSTRAAPIWWPVWFTLYNMGDSYPWWYLNTMSTRAQGPTSPWRVALTFSAEPLPPSRILTPLSFPPSGPQKESLSCGPDPSLPASSSRSLIPSSLALALRAAFLGKLCSRPPYKASQ